MGFILTKLLFQWQFWTLFFNTCSRSGNQWRASFDRMKRWKVLVHGTVFIVSNLSSSVGMSMRHRVLWVKRLHVQDMLIESLKLSRIRCSLANMSYDNALVKTTYESYAYIIITYKWSAATCARHIEVELVPMNPFAGVIKRGSKVAREVSRWLWRL